MKKANILPLAIAILYYSSIIPVQAITFSNGQYNPVDYTINDKVIIKSNTTVDLLTNGRMQDRTFVRDNSELDISGGVTDGAVVASGSSYIKVTDGEIGRNEGAALQLRDTSKLLLAGGRVVNGASIEDNVFAKITGGSIDGYLVLWDYSEAEITGGTIGAGVLAVLFFQQSSAHVHGGDFSGRIELGTHPNWLDESCELFVHGTNFKINGSPVEYGTFTNSAGQGYTDYYLTGTLETGDTISNHIWVDDNSSLILIPGPATVDVRVDIKPESCPNPMPVKGEGVISAAILGSCTLDVTDIDAASITLGGAPAIRSEVRDVGSLGVTLDSMDNIAARPWTDKRDPAEGTGWMSQGAGVMKIDYGVTNDSAGVPHPLSGWTADGTYVGPGGTGGCFGDPALGGAPFGWPGGPYYGRYDREISGPFTFAELGILTTDDCFLLDVYKTVANSPEHVRELQLYDSLGNRNTYSVQYEPLAITVGAGWKTYCVELSAPLENNADLTDIVDVKLWVSSWSAYVFQNFGYPQWPADYIVVPPSGTPVLIDNLRLVRAHDPECGDCLTGSDGIDDLVLKFNRADIVPGLGAVHHGDVVDLDLTGVLLSGQLIEGSDCINIVGKADPAQRPPKK